MKNWKKKLLVSDLLPAIWADPVPVSVMMSVRDRVLALAPEAEFRETNVKHYDADMLTAREDQANFMEDLYDWADENSVWVE